MTREEFVKRWGLAPDSSEYLRDLQALEDAAAERMRERCATACDAAVDEAHRDGWLVLAGGARVVGRMIRALPLREGGAE